MLDETRKRLREDCRTSLATLPGLGARLAGHRIAVVGGTGFVGSWIAETVASLNDGTDGDIRLDLFGRGASLWHESRPHLKREDIRLHTLDVRSPFDLPRDTTLVLFAAGIADPKLHASDPHRVFQTHVNGLDHTLSAAARLERIQRVVHLSSGLAAGGDPAGAVKETDVGSLDFTRLHNAYAESRRAAESIASIYASQYRLPVNTARAFTFLGPYQPLDAPWAINNFIRDALAGQEIRIHGDGSTRRSYLYGSDAAVWLLQAMLEDRDREVHNIGGPIPVTHAEAAACVAARTVPNPALIYKSGPGAAGRSHDFYPDVSGTMRTLGVRAAFDLDAAIGRSLRWHADALGAGRRVRADA